MLDRPAAWMRGPLRRRARDVARDVYLAPRWAQAARSDAFALPSFLIIGARKSGTSSLFDYLLQHPDVRAPLWKETRFFDFGYQKGLAWYRAHFPRREPGARWITGEATTGYLSHPSCAERIACHLPDAKLVAILRNPVDRAISDWAHEQRRGAEQRSAREALGAPDPASPYVARSLYARQLRRYLGRFPRERLLVLRYEDFFAAPAEGYAELLRFLGLAPFDDVRFEHLNPGRGAGDEVDRDALRAFFRPHNRELEELVGLDPSPWD